MAQKTTMIKINAKSSSRLACLTINYPNWKAYLITRSISVVIALISLLSLGLVAEWNRRMLPATQGWQWASLEIQWSFFVPVRVPLSSLVGEFTDSGSRASSPGFGA